jgi:hypothetical protein
MSVPGRLVDVAQIAARCGCTVPEALEVAQAGHLTIFPVPESAVRPPG